jgi:hypothetical protein
VAAVLICCFLLILLTPVFLYLLTYIFRLACSLCGLKKPSILAASGIILVKFVVEGIAEAILKSIVELAGNQAGLPRWEIGIVTFFLALPVDLLIASAIHAGLMGIKFGKGIEVWFVERLIQLSILAAAVLLGVVIYLIQANG